MIRRYLDKIISNGIAGVAPAHYIPLSGTTQNILIIDLYDTNSNPFTSVPCSRVLNQSSFTRIYESNQNSINLDLSYTGENTLCVEPWKQGGLNSSDRCLIICLYEYGPIAIPFIFYFGIDIPDKDIRDDIHNKLGIEYLLQPIPVVSYSEVYNSQVVRIFIDLPA